MAKIKGYLGIDIGSISTKGVVIDQENNILASEYIWTEGDPIAAVKQLLKIIEKKLAEKNVAIMAIGTTGSARELIGAILKAQIIKNEITAHAIGTLSKHPDVKTIFEIGGQDSKIIIVEGGVVVDYQMNTLCAAGTGSFLSSQAKRLNVAVEEFGPYALRSKDPTKIAGRCTVFAESDLVHKAQMGHSKEDLIAGLCQAIVDNYLNNVGKGKNIEPPIVFQGGVSKNIGVIKAFADTVGEEIIVDEIGHLMGSLGIAIIARENGEEKEFNFEISDIDFKTVGFKCDGCPNHCEIVCVFNNEALIDGWGNRCPIGMEKVKAKYKKN